MPTGAGLMGKAMFQITGSALADPAMFQGGVLDDSPARMPLGTLGHAPAPVHGSGNGLWTGVLRARGARTIARHRHSAPVLAWAMDAAWGCREHAWAARAGAFVHEPAGHADTLHIAEDPGHMLAVFHVFGPPICLSDDKALADCEDVFVRIDRHAAHCRTAGLGGDWVRSLIG